MAGNTTTISVQVFRADWDSNIPISALCMKWTITKDQVVRLRDLWSLPLRTDRRLRSKPRHVDPTPEEIAEACRQIRAGWDAATEMDRRTNGKVINMRRIEIPSDTFGHAFEEPWMDG